MTHTHTHDVHTAYSLCTFENNKSTGKKRRREKIKRETYTMINQENWGFNWFFFFGFVLFVFPLFFLFFERDKDTLERKIYRFYGYFFFFFGVLSWIWVYCVSNYVLTWDSIIHFCFLCYSIFLFYFYRINPANNNVRTEWLNMKYRFKDLSLHIRHKNHRSFFFGKLKMRIFQFGSNFSYFFFIRVFCGRRSLRMEWNFGKFNQCF